jgi:hypothetical protein
MAERNLSNPLDSGISRAVTTPDRSRLPRGTTAPLPPHVGPHRRTIGLRELVVAGGVVATVGAGIAVGANLLRQPSQGPDTSPAIPGVIVGPSNSPVPTPFSTENPTVTLPPSPTTEITPTSTPPEATPEPTQNLAELDQRLQDWVNGKIKVPDSKLFVVNKDDKTKEPLNLLIGEKESGRWSAEFQGYVLGQEITKDKTGIDHLVVYMGQKDKKGNHYFIPVNVGRLDGDFASYFFQRTSRQTYVGGQAISHTVPNQEAAKIFPQLADDTILFLGYAFHYEQSEVTDPILDPKEMFESQNTMIEFARFSRSASNGSYRTAIENFPLIKKIINKNVGVLNAKSIPYITQFWVPSEIF